MRQFSILATVIHFRDTMKSKIDYLVRTIKTTQIVIIEKSKAKK